MYPDLGTWVIPGCCAVMKNLMINLAYDSFQTCSNSTKLITILSNKRMLLYGIRDYSWYLNIMMVENFSRIYIFTNASLSELKQST